MCCMNIEHYSPCDQFTAGSVLKVELEQKESSVTPPPVTSQILTRLALKEEKKEDNHKKAAPL